MIEIVCFIAITCLIVISEAWSRAESDRREAFRNLRITVQKLEIAVNQAIKMAEDIGADEIVKVLSPIVRDETTGRKS